jgi:hypothetical protein
MREGLSVTADTSDSLVHWVEKFCGQDSDPHEYIQSIDGYREFPATGIGHSQLNELLLALQLDRTTEGFFRYVFKGQVIRTFEVFQYWINEFRIAAIHKYGNVKFAFKQLSQMAEEDVRSAIGRRDQTQLRRRFVQRHEPLISVKRIEPKDNLLPWLPYKYRTSGKKEEADGGRKANS